MSPMSKQFGERAGKRIDVSQDRLSPWSDELGINPQELRGLPDGKHRSPADLGHRDYLGRKPGTTAWKSRAGL